MTGCAGVWQQHGRVKQVTTNICKYLLHIILTGDLPAVATDLLPIHAHRH